MKDIHLVPDGHSEDDHTTRECVCRPAVAELWSGVLRKERVVFHRETGTETGENK